MDVSNWKDENNQILTSLDGYTVKIWMADGMLSSLAAATEPQTFVIKEGNQIAEVTDGSKIKNFRVFATKNELRCSLGDFSNPNKDEYERKVYEAQTVTGRAATNKKIYFGVYTE